MKVLTTTFTIFDTGASYLYWVHDVRTVELNQMYRPMETNIYTFVRKASFSPMWLDSVCIQL